MNRAIVILVLFIGFCGANVRAQSKSDLQKKRSKILKEIKITNQLIAKNQESQELTETEIKTINKQIELRQALINNINAEVKSVKRKIEENEEVVKSLEASLAAIKKEYSQLVYLAYKNRNAQDKLMYIFASDDFFQALRRLQFIKDIGEHRKEQGQLILDTKKSIDEKNIALIDQRKEKEQLLSEAVVAKKSLDKDKKKKKEALALINQDQDKLKAKLKKKQEEREKLQAAIKAIIDAEIKKNKKVNSSGTYTVTPEDKIKSEFFSKNKGSLPWPVEKGVIVDRFGTKPHPTMSGISITQNGIDIATEEGSAVRAIFEGEVSGILNIPGFGEAVLIKHGEYRVVYSNLKEVWVEKGQVVDTKQEIGTLLSDGKQSIAHIEIWKMTKKQDPELWIAN